jgi:hypothetical protein
MSANSVGLNTEASPGRRLVGKIDEERCIVHPLRGARSRTGRKMSGRRFLRHIRVMLGALWGRWGMLNLTGSISTAHDAIPVIPIRETRRSWVVDIYPK